MRTQRRGIFCLIICFYLLMNTDTTSIIEAQTPRQKVIYQGGVQVMSWGSNSQKLNIVSYDATPPDANASGFLYDITTQSLSSTTGWPFQPTLNPTEQSAFVPAVESGTTSLMYASPDNQYIAYAKLTGSQVSQTYLTIASRDTLRTFTTAIWIPSPYSQNTFVVHWSMDSSSFVFDINYNTGKSSLYYVTNLSADVPTIIEIQSLGIDGQTYYFSGRSRWAAVNPIYDISGDGTNVLIHMGDATSQFEYVVVWNPSTPLSSKVIEDLKAEEIMVVKFVEDSSTRLIFINQEGLHRYDLDVDKLSLITTLYNAKGYDVYDAFSKRALFSPDNRWLAMQDEVPNVGTQVTLTDLQSFNLNARP